MAQSPSTSEPSDYSTILPAAEDPTEVIVLGYHDFSNERPETEMCISTDKFRQQMETIKKLKYNVISLNDFRLWKEGKKNLPDNPALITIDDGWRSVYTDAYPVLKEFGYPFTLYIYTDYLNNHAKSLTHEMVREMQANGATIGSHSVSHHLPSIVKKFRSNGSESFSKYLDKEFGSSQKILQSTFGQAVTTYVYPGGFHLAEMYPVAQKFGYQHLFTVLPGKVTRLTENHLLPRYIVLGTNDSIFNRAIAKGLELAPPLVPVSPEPASRVPSRLPIISVDFSSIPDLDPGSLKMVILGYGNVPASFDAASKTYSWKVNRPIRKRTCTAIVTWGRSNSTEKEADIKWSFLIDKQAAYIPTTDITP